MSPKEIMGHIDGFKRRAEMADWRTALVCSVLANINRDPKKRPKPFQPKDFMPQTEAKKAQTPAEQSRALRAMVIMLGGEIRAS